VAHVENLEEESKLIEAGFEYVRYSNKDKSRSTESGNDHAVD